MKRVKIGLCSVAAVSALALALTPPASAAPAGAARAGAAPAPASPEQALVPARGPVPAGTVRPGAPGSVGTYDNQNGACDSLPDGTGDVCFWYLANLAGSMSDFYVHDANLGDNTFLTPGLGLGQVVANSSESVVNADRRFSVRVFTGTNYTGTSGVIGPRQFGNFTETFRNNVESFFFFS